MNDYGLWIALAGVTAAFLWFRLRGSISETDARKLLEAGGKIIDVRSPEEFAYVRVRNGINVPLGELGQRIGGIAPDKNTPLLCHCASGTRSSAAVGQLKRMGYRRVYNLGSLARAKAIAGS